MKPDILAVEILAALYRSYQANPRALLTGEEIEQGVKAKFGEQTDTPTIVTALNLLRKGRLVDQYNAPNGAGFSMRINETGIEVHKAAVAAAKEAGEKRRDRRHDLVIRYGGLAISVITVAVLLWKFVFRRQ